MRIVQYSCNKRHIDKKRRSWRLLHVYFSLISRFTHLSQYLSLKASPPPLRNFILVSKLHDDASNLTSFAVFSLYFCIVILFRKSGHIKQIKMKTCSTLNTISKNRPPGQIYAYTSRNTELCITFIRKNRQI